MGSNCIISERTSIGFLSEAAADERQGVMIENGVVIEVGAVVEAKSVGEGTIIEVQAKIGKGAVLGKVILPLPILILVLTSLSIVRLVRSVKSTRARLFQTLQSCMGLVYEDWTAAAWKI